MNDQAPQLELMQFTIGTHHTISTGPYENIKVEGSITCGVRRGTTDDQFKEILQLAETRLKDILRETYRSQKIQKQGKPVSNQE